MHYTRTTDEVLATVSQGESNNENKQRNFGDIGSANNGTIHRPISNSNNKKQHQQQHKIENKETTACVNNNVCVTILLVCWLCLPTKYSRVDFDVDHSKYSPNEENYEGNCVFLAGYRGSSHGIPRVSLGVSRLVCPTNKSHRILR